MAQFYTLEEAARALGMTPDELKAKAQHREVRAFLDGGSWRFRVADIDELARRRGLGSDPELRLSDLELPVPGEAGAGDGEKDVNLSEYQMGVSQPDLGQPTVELPSHHAGPPPASSPEAEAFTPDAEGDSGSDHDILLDDLSLPPNPVTGSSSVIIGMDSTGKAPSDSDVRLVPDNPKGASDSDVRLATPQEFKVPSDSDVTLIADDTSSHEMIETPGSGDTTVRPSPLLGSSAEVPASDDMEGSDFELTPSSVIDALQPDSGSDFELSALEGSDEFEATPLRKPGDSDVTAADPGMSGINLSRPTDSGINLQMASGIDLGGASSIELAPLSGSDIQARPAAPKPKPAAAMGPTPSPDDTIAPGSIRAEKDIFDDTDFEVNALDSDADEGSSDDRTVQLEAASDFELEESDTGSEVFAIDEEDVDQNAATAVSAGLDVDDDEAEELDEFAEATSGEMAAASSWDVEGETPSQTMAVRSAPATVLSAAGPAAEWDGLTVGLLGAATVLMMLLAFVSMDLVRNLYDFRSDTPASGIVKSLAGIIASNG
jgi:hypothetical protein